jgi:hypothetical protein
MEDRQHADFPSEEISSRSDFTLLSCGEEPCPFSPHRGFLIPHPSPFSIQYIFNHDVKDASSESGIVPVWESMAAQYIACNQMRIILGYDCSLAGNI